MKKTVLLLVAIIAMCLSASAYKTTAVLLDHNGTITTYEAINIQTAMDDAVDNDVIFLNEGIFPGFTITKKISVKGLGMNTIISGDVRIVMPNDPINDETVLIEPILEYLYIQKRIIVPENSFPIRGLKIKQCQCNGISLYTMIYDSYIDRCYIAGYYVGLDGYYTYNGLYIGKEKVINIDGYNIYYEPYVNGLTVVNSRIDNVYSTSSSNCNATFINCHIIEFGGSGFVKNSIISSTKYRSTHACYARFLYCYYDSGASFGSTCEISRCYERENVEGKNFMEYDSQDIVANGYLGDDGTLIGPLGGNTPYTLIPAIPKVTDGKLSVDPQKQQLNVTLTISPK